MHIGIQIKNRRKEINMTQEELAAKLNVSRTTVANWEQERNYPDMQLIKEISKILDISLNMLLDAENEKNRQKAITLQKHKKIKNVICITLVAFILIVTAGICFWYNNYNFQDIKDGKQIKKVEKNGNTIDVYMDLPIYKSIEGASYNYDENSETIELFLTTKIDLNHKCDLKIVLEEREIKGKIKKIKFMYYDNLVRVFDVK